MISETKDTLVAEFKKQLLEQAKGFKDDMATVDKEKPSNMAMQQHIDKAMSEIKQQLREMEDKLRKTKIKEFMGARGQRLGMWTAGDS